MKMRSWQIWVVAFILVAFAAVYQRMTGPTYAIRSSVTIGGNDLRFGLPRSSGNPGDEEIRLLVADTRIGGFIELKRFKSNDPLVRQELVRQGDALVGSIPHQPPAGKVIYQVYLQGGADPVSLTPEPIIIRFKADVPAGIMIPHIILMFLAMLFSTRAGFEALVKGPNLAKLALWTTVTLAAGGIILGPVVQKYAFGAYWTGWPLGHDLTDNKTAAAFLLWVIALWRIRKSPSARGWALAASIILFLVYMIPHSVLGSELDYSQATPPNA